MLLDEKVIQQALRVNLLAHNSKKKKYGRELLELVCVRAGYTPDQSEREYLQQFVTNLIARFREEHPKPAKLICQHYFSDIRPENMPQRTWMRHVSDDMRLLAKWLLKEETAMRELQHANDDGIWPELGTEQLIGTETAEVELIRQILYPNPEHNHITYISGIGGIGKTALIQQLISRIVKERFFDHTVVVRYKPNSLTGESLTVEGAYIQMMARLAALPHVDAVGLPAEQRDRKIHAALRQARHLVVVDNIEEVPVSDALLPRLKRFESYTRFVVGSRTLPKENVFHYQVKPLSAENSLKLLRLVAQQQNLNELAALSDTALSQIYTIVGGNPLALKLAASLSMSMPYQPMITELGRGEIKPSAEMFERIYANLWDTIADEAKALLCAMLLLRDDANWQDMMAFSGLDDLAFWDALKALTDRSLVEIQGTLIERRYGIHRLTAAYLEGRCG